MTNSLRMTLLFVAIGIAGTTALAGDIPETPEHVVGDDPYPFDTVDARVEEKEAIEFIQEYEPSEGYYLGFSGGKDSVVLHALAEKAKVKFEAYYSITGIDPPELIRFVREFYPDVKRVHPRILLRLPR